MNASQILVPALVASRLLSGMLHGVTAADWIGYAAALAALLMAGGAAVCVCDESRATGSRGDSEVS